MRRSRNRGVAACAGSSAGASTRALAGGCCAHCMQNPRAAAPSTGRGVGSLLRHCHAHRSGAEHCSRADNSCRGSASSATPWTSRLARGVQTGLLDGKRAAPRSLCSAPDACVLRGYARRCDALALS
jgi:hypothetical protein